MYPYDLFETHVRQKQEELHAEMSQLRSWLDQRERSSTPTVRLRLARMLRTLADQLDSGAIRQEA